MVYLVTVAGGDLVGAVGSNYFYIYMIFYNDILLHRFEAYMITLQ